MYWISVKDKTPENFEDILFTNGKRVFIGFRAYIYNDDDDFYYYSNEGNYKDITHWMPLPPLTNNELCSIEPGEPGYILTSDNEGKPKFVYTSTSQVPKISKAINPDLLKEGIK